MNTSSPALLDLNESTLRTSESYELVLFDRLPAEEQHVLRELLDDPGFYGVLRPQQDSGRTIKAVGRETALLLLTLRQPGPLPFYVRRSGNGLLKEVIELVTDGVLEVHDGRSFVSGPEAFSRLRRTGESPSGDSFLTRLSIDALRHAERLHDAEADTVFSRLYSYNLVPVSPRWLRRFPNAASIAEYLGVGPGGPLRDALEAHWRGRDADATPGWLSWSRRSPGQALELGRGQPHYKLYVSPRVEALPATVEMLLGCLHRHPAHAFKVGADAHGILRSDKVVVYFADLEGLAAAANELQDSLREIPVQGVPFTTAIDGRGLLSWGMDPPRSEQVVSWSERDSWRTWVTRRLAAALVAARKAERGELPPWRFAMERLRLQGVDVDRWTPSVDLWGVAAPAREGGR